jgi:hypothetical protein
LLHSLVSTLLWLRAVLLLVLLLLVVVVLVVVLVVGCVLLKGRASVILSTCRDGVEVLGQASKLKKHVKRCWYLPMLLRNNNAWARGADGCSGCHAFVLLV